MAQIFPSVNSRIGSDSDPLFGISLRAFLTDLVILSLGVGTYTLAMVQVGALYDRLDTAITALALVVLWLLCILAHGGYEGRALGIGSEEFKRLVSSVVTVLAVVSVVAYVLRVPPPLRLVIPSLVVGLLLLLTGRWLLRIWLGRQRVAGRFQQRTLIVGDRLRSATLSEAFAADPVAGFCVIATVQPPAAGSSPRILEDWLDDVINWTEENDVDAVAVAESRALEPDLLRRLSWRLDGPHTDLLVAPALSDIAGPRVSVRPAAGLPLLRLDEPTLTGPKRVLKRCVDLAITIPAVIFLMPLMAAIALAIKFDSLGHVLYIHERVGRSGEAFKCLKFRSMHVGADAIRHEIIGLPDEFIAARYRSDPRVTRVGRFLRRWSLDELPQLFNVLGGSMSLVGPRPMLPEELPLLGDSEHRRHLTKPGLTGLWQVSGRKEVSWDDRMRMDLHYVESWSFALDLIILAKTAKAVLAGRGAY